MQVPDHDHNIESTIECRPIQNVSTIAYNSLHKTFANLVNNPLLSDVHFRIGGDDIVHSHRLVLAAWSDIFRAMFTNGMSESLKGNSIGENNNSALTEDVDTVCISLDKGDPSLPGFSKTCLLSALSFMYAGDTSFVDDHTQVLPILAFSNKYCIQSLKTVCESFFQKHISVQTCCSNISLAQRFNCEELLSKSMEFTKLHFEESSNTESFLMLSKDTLVLLLAEDELSVCTEEVVYEIISKWMLFDLPVRIYHSKEILSLIRFPLMKPEYLAAKIEQSPQYYSRFNDLRHVREIEELMKGHLLRAYRFHAVPVSHKQFVTERGREQVLFGEEQGFLDTSSKSMSSTHPVENIRFKNEKYWIPVNPERAEFEIFFSGLKRISSFTIQNRHSNEFEVFYRNREDTEWETLTSPQESGKNRDIHHFDMRILKAGSSVVTSGMKFVISGRTHSSYHTSIYYVEIKGRSVSCSHV